MSVLKEYCNAFERESDILFKQFEIDISRLDNELTMESSFQELEESLFIEAETLDINDISNSKKKKDGKFSKVLYGICEAVTKLITDVIEMVSNLFSSNSHIDIETYLKSSKGSIELEYDLKKIQNEVNTEVRKGRKLIQAISRGTKVDDETVERYVDNASKCLLKHGKVIMTTGKSYELLNHATGNLDGLKQEMKEALSYVDGAGGDPQKELQIKKVYKAMRHLSTAEARIYADFCNQIQKDAIKQ